MTDERSLLDAILAHPDEDMPRLMYADWLQEHGQDERAEFIRVQIELARLGQFGGWECKVCGARPVPMAELEFGEVEHGKGCYTLFEDGGGSEFVETDEAYKAIRAREQELLVESAKSARHFADPNLLTYWLRGRPAGLPADRPDALVGLFVRGFIERVDGPAADWLKHGDQILAAHPVRKVKLTTMPTVERLRGFCCRLAGRTKTLSVVFPPPGASLISVRNRQAEDLLRAEWPGITFELPPAPV